MYSVIVPLTNSTVTKETRDIYLKQLKAAKVNRIFLDIFGYGTEPETDLITAEALRENIEFFGREGIEAGVWIGYTIGHGADLAIGADFVPDISGYTKMMSLSGEVRENVCCPLDKNFRARMATYVSNIATSGAKTVLLDDDFRMSHGRGYCCACDLHMARISELCGEDVSRERLMEMAFTGKPNKYRKAWLTAQGEGLEIMARDIRDAVDKLAPDVRVSFCTTCMHFGVDGSDPIKLTKILTGKSATPFIRLSGAPYWTNGARPLISIIEIARMFACFCKNQGVELVSEGDTYPRPRYNVPSSYLEIYDAALRVDGQYDGILKYMVDYNGTPNFETSYLSRHEKNLPLMRGLDEIFDGKKPLGVNICLQKDAYKDLRDNADFEINGGSLKDPYPSEGAFLAFNGISAAYGEGGPCRIVFGENARGVDLSELENGAILDGLAAQILRERGVDVGIVDSVKFEDRAALYLTDVSEKERAFAHPSGVKYAEMKLSDKTEVVCKIIFGDGVMPFAYRYEGASGAKFLVFAFDSSSLSEDNGMYRGYLQQQVLKEGVEWISGKRLPAFIEKCPNLYLMCKGGDGKTAVALFNIFADSVDNGVITLDKEYSSIRFINCSGRLEGDKVILDSSIPAYSFAAFEVS